MRGGVQFSIATPFVLALSEAGIARKVARIVPVAIIKR